MSDLLIEPKLAVLDHMKALPEAPMAEDEDFEVWGPCKGTTCFPCTTTFLLITSYHFLSLCNYFQPPAMSFNLVQFFADHCRPLQIIAEGRIASHGFARISHSGLPNMGGLVLYMVTCIYTFRTDQGSLESISKDFPCVRYVAL